MQGSDTSELTKLIFVSIVSEYQNNFFEKINKSAPAFDYVNRILL